MAKNRALFLGFALIAAFALVFILVYFGFVSSWDVSAFIAINQTFNMPALNGFFVALSLYGREYFWIPVVAILWIFGKEREKKAALMLVVVFIILIAIGLSMKTVYFRERPFYTVQGAVNLMPGPPDTDSSFPSGHAIIVIGGAATVFMMLRKRYWIWAPLLAEALLVCYSRVYVGVHYPTDVLAGAFLSAGIAALVFWAIHDSKAFEMVYRLVEKPYSKTLKVIGGALKR